MTKRRTSCLFLILLGFIYPKVLVFAQVTPPNVPTPRTAQVDTTQVPSGPIGKLVEILNADETIGTATSRTLRGNVRLRQENTLLRAQQVVERFDSNVITLSGKVWMVQNGDTLTADQIVYNAINKQAKATGNIRVSNGQTRIFTTSGDYDAQTKLVHFTTGARILDSTAVITAKMGRFSNQDKWGNFEGDVKLVDGKTILTAAKGSYNTTYKWGEFEGNVRLIDENIELKSSKGVYYRDLQEAFFYGNVVLKHPDFQLKADSVTHNRKTDISFARGNVYLERFDKESEKNNTSVARTFLFGRSLYHTNKTKTSVLRGNPLVIRLKSKKENQAVLDTLFMASRMIETNEPSAGQQIILARGQTRIRQGSFAARSDSLRYEKSETSTQFRESIRLFKAPLVWSRDSQISGDTLRLNLKEGKPDTLFVFGRAFVAKLDSVLNKINQLKGKKLVGFFKEDTLRTVTISPQAEAIYFTKDELNKLSQGIELKSDWLYLTFENENIKTLDAFKPDGTIYEAEIIPENLQLNGFNWQPEERPKKSDFPVDAAQWAWIRERMELPPERKASETVTPLTAKPKTPRKPRGKRTNTARTKR